MQLSDNNLSTKQRMATLLGFEEEPDLEEQERLPVQKAEQDIPDPRDKPSPRPIWSRPSNKLALVLVCGIVPALAGFALMTRMTNPLTQKPEVKTKLEEFPDPVVPEKDSDVGRLKTDVALNDQVEAISQINEESKKNPASHSQVSRTTATPTTKAPPRPVAVQPVSRVQPRIYPRPTYTASRPTSPAIPSSRPAVSFPVRPSYSPPPQATENVEPVDPTEAWLAAARLGSYGMTSTSPSASSSPKQEQMVEAVSNEQDVAATVPAVYQSTAFEPTPEASYSEEAAILQGRPQMVVLLGSKAAAEIEDPMTWEAPTAENAAPDHYLIRLRQPLMASDGKAALPAETRLVVVPQSVSDAGRVELVVVSALLPGRQQVEMSLPEGAIQIRGAKGEALIASNITKNREQGGMDFGMALLNGVTQAAELLNRPRSQSTYSSDGGFFSSTENGTPDILAGLLQGSTESITSQLSDSYSRRQNQRENDGPQSPVWVLKAGKEVQVYANQDLVL